ncbi:MAG: ATP-binding protein [Gammaproteobacteria bacterium]|nr:ATP-binding protein [Gammaproteobacteria bacterium]MDH5650470.1 ATP-binding protein [Gammaproteobacteria bacterium]
MALATLKRLINSSTAVAVLFMLLLASLYLLSGSTHDSILFGRLYSVLLVINLAAIFLLLVLIGNNLYQLVRQYRARVTGSRLTARLVVLFIILSVTPVSVVYYFSLEFLKRGIDSWFDVRVEDALKDALELSQASLGIRMHELLRETEQVAAQLHAVPDELMALTLNDQRSKSGMAELTVFSASGRIIAASSKETAGLVPQRLSDSTYLRIHQGQPDVGLIPISDKELSIRIAVALQPHHPVNEKRILQALYDIPERINVLADSVQSAFGDYNELAYLRIPLKYSFILTLSLVLLLSILTAIWAAFFYARRMVAPITDLVEGTQAVAAGNYDKRLPLPGGDELGLLVLSFNQMTQKIAMANDAAKQSQQLMEQQNAYLEVVLAHLSSGVLTFDNKHRLHSSNTAAGHILNLGLQGFQGQTLQAVSLAVPQLQPLSDVISKHLQAHTQEWRDEVTLFGPGGRQVLMCRGTPLPHTITLQGGHVVVFDDITNLLQAQRNAAWGEVARRLAHEIKNPLTPIQLSAERLRRKYLDAMDADDAEVLDRSTHTIVQQVETLKEMVKAFSDYARMPALQLQPVDLNTIVAEVSELYHDDETGVRITIQRDSGMPLIEADPGRLRQLLHNLIKNGIEAMPDERTAHLTLTTHCVKDDKCRYIELRIEDNGPGIPEQLFEQLFEPYVTTKPKGSGLGLAIVKKIVEEHGGIIRAENLPRGGASVILRLPVTALSPDTETNPNPDSELENNSNAAA